MINRIKRYIDSYAKYDWKRIGNGNAVSALLDCMWSRLVDGTNTEQFISLEFYRRSQRERNLFVTNRRTVRFEKQTTRGVTQQELDTIRNKVLFNEKYKKFVKRQYIFTKNASVQQVEEFICNNRKVLAKPIASTQGKGIEVIEYNAATGADIAKRFAGAEYIMEQFLVQHPEMNKVNPTSVNTIRLCTVLDKHHKAHVIGAGLRCGGKGSFVDNFHSGGVGYPIDVEYGIVSGRGRNNSSMESYACHPATNFQMIGFKIPHWHLVLDSVCQAAEMSDKLCYLAWDVAITEEGIEIIEANDGQGCTIWQLDNVGKYKQIKALLNR